MSENNSKKVNGTRSYRFTEEQNIKIESLAKELGVSQSGALEALISSYELQKGALRMAMSR